MVRREADAHVHKLTAACGAGELAQVVFGSHTGAGDFYERRADAASVHKERGPAGAAVGGLADPGLAGLELIRGVQGLDPLESTDPVSHREGLAVQEATGLGGLFIEHGLDLVALDAG